MKSVVNNSQQGNAAINKFVSNTSSQLLNKRFVTDLALFGGQPEFDTIKPTGQLDQIDREAFWKCMESMYRNRRCTNNGPLVRELEERLKKFHSVNHCIAFSNASFALMVAMQQLSSCPGEVILPSFSFVGLPHIVRWAGHTPVFCDVDRETHTVDVDSVSRLISPRTSLILAVNNVTSPCDMHRLEALAESHGIPLLFDSVYGVGCTYNGVKLGSFGRAEVFSLHATKLINGFEGGYVTTNDDHLASELKCARAFGFTAKDYVATLGLNAKLNEVHAASALVSLESVEKTIRRNKERHGLYTECFSDLPGLSIVPYRSNEQNNYVMSLLRIDDEWPLSTEMTIKILRAEKVLARPYFSPPLHHDETNAGAAPVALPVTDELSNRYVQLPVGERTDNDDIRRISELFRFIFTHSGSIINRLSLETVS
jgi:dTDP-4-amino-4,6-dideoxygalactose transaminase